MDSVLHCCENLSHRWLLGCRELSDNERTTSLAATGMSVAEVTLAAQPKPGPFRVKISSSYGEVTAMSSLELSLADSGGRLSSKTRGKWSVLRAPCVTTQVLRGFGTTDIAPLTRRLGQALPPASNSRDLRRITMRLTVYHQAAA